MLGVLRNLLTIFCIPAMFGWVILACQVIGFFSSSSWFLRSLKNHPILQIYMLIGILIFLILSLL